MKSEKLTSFALVIAAVALLIVGAMSYRDYLKAKYEKEFGVAGSSQSQGRVNGQGPEERVAAVEALPPARSPGTPAPLSPETGQSAPLPASPDPAAPPPATPDPRISQYQQNLDKLQQENLLYRQKLDEAIAGAPIPRPALPSSAVAAAGGLPPVPAPMGDTFGESSPAEIRQEVSAIAEKVRKEASIATVLEYDSEWAFLVLDGGRNRGIEQEMRFAVRRGGEILGWVKITEVEQDRSVAHLMSDNKNSQTKRKPARGDDIIAFKLF